MTFLLKEIGIELIFEVSTEIKPQIEQKNDN